MMSWERLRTFITVLTFLGVLASGWMSLDRAVQARLTREDAEHVIDMKIGGMSSTLAEILRRLERIERKQDDEIAQRERRR